MIKRKNKKVLFVRFSSIGDIVLVHPVIQEYKRLYANDSVHFATKDVYLDLVQNNPDIDKSFYLKTSNFRELFHLAKILRKEKYDLLIDLHNSLRSRMFRILLFFSAKKVRTFRKPYLKRLFLIVFKWDLFPPKTSIIEAYGRAAGIQLQAEQAWDFPLLQIDKNTVQEILQKNNNSGLFRLAIMASARWKTKAWPPEYYIEFIRNLD